MIYGADFGGLDIPVEVRKALGDRKRFVLDAGRTVTVVASLISATDEPSQLMDLRSRAIDAGHLITFTHAITRGVAAERCLWIGVYVYPKQKRGNT